MSLLASSIDDTAALYSFTSWIARLTSMSRRMSDRPWRLGGGEEKEGTEEVVRGEEDGRA